MQELTNAEIGNLIHYLVLEELGEVSWQKLNQALRQTARDAPLKQDRVEDIRRRTEAVKSQLVNSDVKPIITHFHKWMKENGYTVPQMFRLQSHQLKDNYPQNLFEEKL